MALESNTKTLTSLRKFYQRLETNKDFDLRIPCKDDIIELVVHVDNMVCDLKTQISRAQLLAHIATDRKALVSILRYFNPKGNFDILMHHRFSNVK